MKKLFTIFFATLLCLFSINTVHAKDIYVSDETHILSDSEINDLNVIAENLEADYGVGVYFMAYDSHNIDTFEYGNEYLSKVNSEKAVGLVINLDDYTYTFVSKGDVGFDEYDYDYLIQCFEDEDTYYDAVSSYMKEAALKYQLLNNSDVADERKYDLLVDDANLLSENEKQNLLASLNEVSQRQKMDIVVVTCYSLDGKSATGVPYIVIGDKAFGGFDKSTDGDAIKSKIKELYESKDRYDVFEEMEKEPKDSTSTIIMWNAIFTTLAVGIILYINNRQICQETKFF